MDLSSDTGPSNLEVHVGIDNRVGHKTHPYFDPLLKVSFRLSTLDPRVRLYKNQDGFQIHFYYINTFINVHPFYLRNCILISTYSN